MTTSTLSQTGQTTIPAKVRDFLHVGPNDRIVYLFEGGRVVMEPAPASTTAALYGVFKTGRKPPTKEEIRQARRSHYTRKLAK